MTQPGTSSQTRADDLRARCPLAAWPRVSWLAVWAMILAVLALPGASLMIALAAGILGLLALRNIARSGGRLSGKGLAIFGLVVCSLVMVAWSIWLWLGWIHVFDLLGLPLFPFPDSGI